MAFRFGCKVMQRAENAVLFRTVIYRYCHLPPFGGVSVPWQKLGSGSGWRWFVRQVGRFHTANVVFMPRKCAVCVWQTGCMFRKCAVCVW